MVATLSTDTRCVGLVNVYMPYDDRTIDVMNEYSHVLGELQASISELPTDDIICLGDFNADPSRGRLWNNVVEFCNENQFNICDTILPPDTFTYLSPSHNSTSWLDHVLCSGDVNVTEIKILHEFALFDHFPVFTVIGMETGESLINLKDNLVKHFVDWGKFNKEEYVCKMEALMSNVDTVYVTELAAQMIIDVILIGIMIK